MHTPLRILRERAAEIPGVSPNFSPSELTRRATILRAGRTLMAEEGRSAFTLAKFAGMIWITAATIRRHFIDMDSLLFDILMDHLRSLSAALGAVPRSAPDRPAACRAAYLAHTRTAWGGLTEAHRLFVRDRACLPPDDRAALERIHLGLGHFLGGESDVSTIQLLDTEILEAEEIEEIIAGRMLRAARYAALSHADTRGRAAAPEAPPPEAKPTPAASLPAEPEPEPAADPDPEPLPATLPDDPAEAVAACLALLPRLGPSREKPLHRAPRPPDRPRVPEPNPFPSLYERVLQDLARAGPKVGP
jgi:AcrR family transcriptional regulator